MRILVVAASLVLLLAGCSGPPAAAPSSTLPDGSVVAAGDKGVAAPEWAVGDWWNFTGPFGGFDYVVSAADGDDYTIDTGARSLAWFDARNDISTMGPVRKSDLAGSQGQTRVQFFDFPLKDNKTWTMTLDEGQGGGELKVTAKRTGADTFQMTARFDNGTAYLSYTYSNKTKWFTEIDFKDGQGGSAFKVALARHGKGFSGDLVRWDFTTVVEVEGDLATARPETMFYGVPVTATDVYVDVELHCTAGAAGAGTAPVPFVGSLAGTDNRGAGDPGAQCPLDVSFHGSAGPVQPPATGQVEQWGWDLVGGAGTTGTYDFSIFVRTATPFKAGEVPV